MKTLSSIHGLLKQKFNRKSAVIVWTAISITTLIGFAALSLDLGYIQVVRGQIQRAADSAAMAGVSAFTSPSQFTANYNRDDITSLATSRALAYGAKNSADGKFLILAASNILVGNLAHPESMTDTISTSTYPYNAVRCTVEKSTASANGAVPTFFAKIWGINNTAISATATAVLNTHLGGYKPGTNGGPLIPITIDQATWTDMITNKNGADTYAFDYETKQINHSNDGIPEINIYPDKKKTDTGGSGNFGLLNFNNGNNSVNPVGDQIQNGLTADEVTRTIGSDTFVFYKDVISPSNEVVGTSITYALDGTPGLKASLQSAFTSRIGTVVGVFINSQVVGPGSNCVYTITGIQYGILLAADLTGNNKAVIIQPTVYVGSENIIVPDAPTNPTAGRISLVR
ncbi:MAG: TadG family pilus assembly protein [Phycisphaerae bacterium]